MTVTYALSLHIGYRYEAPVANARHMVRVAPLAMPGRQTVSDFAFTVSPKPEEQQSFTGYFGEEAVSISLRGAHKSLDIKMACRLSVEPPGFRPELSLRLCDLAPALAAVTDFGPASPNHFTGVSPRVPFPKAVSAFSADLAEAESPVADIAHAVMARIHKSFAYDPDATDAQTSVEEAFTLKRGVCQDFSHVMISALRSHGIPAGYVSGYLRTIPPEGKPRLEGADAMHAWVRVWCGPEAGWIEYDPTNNCLAGTDHIVAAYGRDYSDVSPIVGVLKSFGSHQAFQAVDVVPLTEGTLTPAKIPASEPKRSR